MAVYEEEDSLVCREVLDLQDGEGRASDAAWKVAASKGSRMEMKQSTMDFITMFPKTKKGFDVIWVIVDRLTKIAHFLAI